jgi:beta-galactosidase
VASAEAACSIPPDDVTTLTLETTVDSPLLWSPDEPNLYELALVAYEDGMPRDDIRIPFGFRWFRFDIDKGFFLNGRRLKLNGVNRHQCYPGLGNAVPKSLQVKDAELIKDMGGNFVRLSHYPQHPAFLDACDRLGVIVYEEIASWQYIGGRTFGENAVAMMGSMIRRDRNHPSVMLWGLLNEGRSASLFRALNDTAHREDPTRLTVYAENKPDRGKQLGTTSIPDVLGINYKLPHVDEIRALLPDAKLFSSEHTNADATVRGKFELEMKQAERISGDLDIIEAHGYMAGSALWSMHDYGTDYEPVWPVQRSGILDMYRIPKEAYYRMKSRWITSPFVHIAGHWTWTGDEGKSKTVTVWSNCDEVELFLNEISLGARQAERVFEWTVPFGPGVLKAVGRTAEGSTSDTLTTAGPPDRIELSGEPTVLRADGVSVSVVTARIVDEKGITVPSADHEITFAVQGGATIRGIGGKPRSTAAAGLARMIVQSGLTPDDVTLTATATGLDPGTLRLRTTGD